MFRHIGIWFPQVEYPPGLQGRCLDRAPWAHSQRLGGLHPAPHSTPAFWEALHSINRNSLLVEHRDHANPRNLTDKEEFPGKLGTPGNVPGSHVRTLSQGSSYMPPIALPELSGYCFYINENKIQRVWLRLSMALNT